MPPSRITSAENPRIKALIHLRKHRQREQQALFIAEGEREIDRALSAGLVLQEVFHSHPFSVFPGLLERLPSSVSVIELTDSLMRKVSLLDNPPGILAVVQTPTWNLDQIVPKDSHAPFFVIAEGLAKPGNLGAIARTALAAGVDAILISGEGVDPFNPNAIRASTGAVFTLPIVTESQDRIEAFIKRHRAKLVIATPDAHLTHTSADLAQGIALVIGAEDTGVSSHWRETSQATGGIFVHIPMARSAVDSLNASVAAGILLFEAVRQRALPRRL